MARLISSCRRWNSCSVWLCSTVDDVVAQPRGQLPTLDGFGATSTTNGERAAYENIVFVSSAGVEIACALLKLAAIVSTPTCFAVWCSIVNMSLELLHVSILRVTAAWYLVSSWRHGYIAQRHQAAAASNEPTRPRVWHSLLDVTHGRRAMGVYQATMVAAATACCTLLLWFSCARLLESREQIAPVVQHLDQFQAHARHGDITRMSWICMILIAVIRGSAYLFCRRLRHFGGMLFLRKAADHRDELAAESVLLFAVLCSLLAWDQFDPFFSSLICGHMWVRWIIGCNVLVRDWTVGAITSQQELDWRVEDQDLQTTPVTAIMSAIARTVEAAAIDKLRAGQPPRLGGGHGPEEPIGKLTSLSVMLVADTNAMIDGCPPNNNMLNLITSSRCQFKQQEGPSLRWIPAIQVALHLQISDSIRDANWVHFQQTFEPWLNTVLGHPTCTEMSSLRRMPEDADGGWPDARDGWPRVTTEVRFDS